MNSDEPIPEPAATAPLRPVPPKSRFNRRSRPDATAAARPAAAPVCGEVNDLANAREVLSGQHPRGYAPDAPAPPQPPVTRPTPVLPPVTRLPTTPPPAPPTPPPESRPPATPRPAPRAPEPASPREISRLAATAASMAGAPARDDDRQRPPAVSARPEERPPARPPTPSDDDARFRPPGWDSSAAAAPDNARHTAPREPRPPRREQPPSAGSAPAHNRSHYLALKPDPANDPAPRRARTGATVPPAAHEGTARAARPAHKSLPFQARAQSNAASANRPHPPNAQRSLSGHGETSAIPRQPTPRRVGLLGRIKHFFGLGDPQAAPLLAPHHSSSQEIRRYEPDLARGEIAPGARAPSRRRRGGRGRGRGGHHQPGGGAPPPSPSA